MGDKEVKVSKEDNINRKCAQTGKALKRVRRYFRNGKYFVNKNAYKAYAEKMSAEGAEAASEEKK